MSQDIVDSHWRWGHGPGALLGRGGGGERSQPEPLLARYKQGGFAAVEPRSRRPSSSPTRTSAEVQRAIVELRQELVALGVDAGAQTIAHHLQLRFGASPSRPTIWRILKATGLITPQPHKRPKSSWIRFEAQLPNEMWQADSTHWQLADGSDVEILNLIDDHSRFCLASVAHPTIKAVDVQTCGKVERFHHTLKLFLRRQAAAQNLAHLQLQLDAFRVYYNQQRPHSSARGQTPFQAFHARLKAGPSQASSVLQYRVRRDRLDGRGKVTIRYLGRLRHLYVSYKHKREPVTLLVAGSRIKVVAQDGSILRELTLDAARGYQQVGQQARSSMS